MVTTHRIVAFLVLAATFGSAALAGLAYYRRREPRGIVTHLLALTQTLLIAQVGLGLLLLSDHHRAPHRLPHLSPPPRPPRAPTSTARSPCSQFSHPGSTRPTSAVRASPGSPELPWSQERSR